MPARGPDVVRRSTGPSRPHLPGARDCAMFQALARSTFERLVAPGHSHETDRRIDRIRAALGDHVSDPVQASVET